MAGKRDETCPVCGKILGNVPGIGPVCGNQNCPVVDDADLWRESHEKLCKDIMADCKNGDDISDVDQQYSRGLLEACSHNAVLLYLRSEKRKPFLRALKKYGYELRVVLKGQCY